MIWIVVGVVLVGAVALQMFANRPRNKSYVGSANSILSDLIEYNAQIIVRDEGKAREEALYLSLCLVYDDLAAKQNQNGIRDLMYIAQTKYTAQFNDIMTYAAWVSGAITLKPEFDAALRARHAKVS